MCFQKEVFGFLPADARVSNGYAVFQLGGVVAQFLAALDQVAFQHHADDRVIARHALANHVSPNPGLLAVIFA